MKVTFLQLSQQLQQKPLATMYLIVGDEHFLILESVELIRVQALAAGRERCRYDIHQDDDWLLCDQQLRTRPLLAQNLLFELYLHNPLTALGQKLLLAYAHRAKQHLIIVIMPRLSTSLMKTSWYKELLDLSVIVDVWPLLGKELLVWLIQRAKKYGLQLNAEAANYLVDNTAGNIAAAVQTLTQLSLTGSKAIDYDCIKAVLADQAVFSAFDLIKHSCLGNAVQVLKILRFLEQSETPPLVILGAAIYELRILSKLARERQHGGNLAAVCLRYRLSKIRQHSANCFLQRHNLSDCYQLICQATAIERLIKGSTRGSIWPALVDFFLTLCLGSKYANLMPPLMSH
jgi:DNA polymerase-3 subunit delta